MTTPDETTVAGTVLDPVLCDRCRCGRRATETVTCWYGCEHRQCALCAQYTRMEAEEGP